MVEYRPEKPTVVVQSTFPHFYKENMMLKKTKKSKNKKYKFFAANLWGALFLTKRFRRS